MVSGTRMSRTAPDTPADLLDTVKNGPRKSSLLTDIYDGPADDDKPHPAPVTLPRPKLPPSVTEDI
jgi:hypothetical protein